MTCEITTTASGGIGGPHEVATPVDQGKTDAQNLDDNLRDVTNTPGATTSTRLSTTWPGRDEPVVTTRDPEEGWASYMSRHKGRCTAALVADPIDCP